VGARRDNNINLNVSCSLSEFTLNLKLRRLQHNDTLDRPPVHRLSRWHLKGHVDSQLELEVGKGQVGAESHWLLLKFF
jgi:hypothetical protein